MFVTVFSVSSREDGEKDALRTLSIGACFLDMLPMPILSIPLEYGIELKMVTRAQGHRVPHRERGVCFKGQISRTDVVGGMSKMQSLYKANLLQFLQTFSCSASSCHAYAYAGEP